MTPDTRYNKAIKTLFRFITSYKKGLGRYSLAFITSVVIASVNAPFSFCIIRQLNRHQHLEYVDLQIFISLSLTKKDNA